MAPALLTNDKLADKKGKQSSKQNKRKMDPESHTQEELSKDRKNNSDSQEIVKQNKIAAVVNHLAEKTVSNGTKKAKSKKSKKNSLNGEVSEEVDMSSQKKIEETLPEIKTTEDGPCRAAAIDTRSVIHHPPTPFESCAVLLLFFVFFFLLLPSSR